MFDMWNVAEPLEVEYSKLIQQSSDQSNSNRKGKQPCGEEIVGQDYKSRRDHQSNGQTLMSLLKKSTRDKTGKP